MELEFCAANAHKILKFFEEKIFCIKYSEWVAFSKHPEMEIVQEQN